MQGAGDAAAPAPDIVSAYYYKPWIRQNPVLFLTKRLIFHRPDGGRGAGDGEKAEEGLEGRRDLWYDRIVEWDSPDRTGRSAGRAERRKRRKRK